MKAEVFIDEPIPPNVGLSYGEIGFGKFGVCVWEYENGYFGPINWINFRKSLFKPEYDFPIAFHYRFAENVIGVVTLKAELYSGLFDLVVGSIPTNLLKGLGIPVRPPH